MAAAKSDKKEEKTKTSVKPSTPRDKKLDLALQDIAKKYGEGSIMRLGDAKAKVNMESISTGCMLIDHALGIGGVPRGRIVEIYGPESSGKTTLTLSIVAQAQKAGGVAAFIDVEHALDPKYAGNLGVDMNELLVSQPSSGEEALNIAETLIKSNTVDVVVVDSVAALITKAEIEGQIGDATVGQQARLMSSALRKLTSVINRAKTTCIFTNQLREKIGIMFGNPEVTPGGKALKFYASVRMDIRRIGQLKKPDGSVYGNRTRVKVVKNKVAPPFTECEFDILYDQGISNEGAMLDMSIQRGVVDKRGAWIYFDGEQIAQGRESALATLKGDEVLRKKIEEKLKEKLAETV